MNSHRQMKILQVVGGLDRAGTETWLLNVLQHIDRGFSFDFLVHENKNYAYKHLAERCGARLLVCPNPHRPLAYGARFLKLLRQNGPYDAVHCHLQHYNGYVLLLAKAAGIPRRIAHSHNATKPLGSKRFSRLGYTTLMRALVRSCSTSRLAVSQQAAESLFGRRWANLPRTQVLLCGVDLTPFDEGPGGQSLRDALGLRPTDYVVGHVGRFVEQKNHLFLVNLAEQLASWDRSCVFLLAGDGPLRPHIEAAVEARNLSARFRFLGSRPDISRLMLGAMDVFVLPSLYEGLGLVGVEAQAAGLRVVAASHLPDELSVVPDAVIRIPLAEGARAWAEAVKLTASAPRLSRTDCLRWVEESDFNLPRHISKLTKVYEV